VSRKFFWEPIGRKEKQKNQLGRSPKAGGNYEKNGVPPRRFL